MNKEGDFSISYSELMEAKSKKGVLVWNLLVTRDKTIQTGFFKKGQKALVGLYKQVASGGEIQLGKQTKHKQLVTSKLQALSRWSATNIIVLNPCPPLGPAFPYAVCLPDSLRWLRTEPDSHFLGLCVMGERSLFI